MFLVFLIKDYYCALLSFINDPLIFRTLVNIKLEIKYLRHEEIYQVDKYFDLVKDTIYVTWYNNDNEYITIFYLTKM